MSSPASEPLRDAAGAAARVEELYAHHFSLVRSICRSLLRNGSEAEDAVQQTFLSAQRALANGSSPREPAAWLAAIARNECLARVRARMREPLPVDAEATDVGADAHTVAVQRQEVGELRQALADLPPQQREAILLRELRGLSYEEVASTLSVTTSAVESLIFRARRRLQTRLREVIAALSPGELVGRILGGGGLAAPAAAKVVAVGLGTALVGGGAVLGPDVIGLGHAPVASHVSKTAAPAQRSPAAVAVVPAAPSRPQTIWGAIPQPRTQDVVRRERGDSGSAAAPARETTDTQEAAVAPERTSGDTATPTSSSSSGSSDSVETQTISSDTGTGGETGDSIPGSGSSSGDTTTTPDLTGSGD